MNRVQSDYKKKEKRHLLRLILIPVLLILLTLVESLESSTLLNQEQTQGVILFAIYLLLVYHLIDWSCPKCDRFPGRKVSLKYCSNCGVQLKK